MGINEADIKIIVLVIFVIWIKLLYISLEDKNLLCAIILACPGFILMLMVLTLTWGLAFGEWLKASG